MNLSRNIPKIVAATTLTQVITKELEKNRLSKSRPVTSECFINDPLFNLAKETKNYRLPYIGPKKGTVLDRNFYLIQYFADLLVKKISEI